MKHPSGPSPTIGPNPATIGHMLPPPCERQSTSHPITSAVSAAAIASWICRAKAFAASVVPLNATTRT
jgi:hypothetical protein